MLRSAHKYFPHLSKNWSHYFTGYVTRLFLLLLLLYKHTKNTCACMCMCIPPHELIIVSICNLTCDLYNTCKILKWISILLWAPALWQIHRYSSNPVSEVLDCSSLRLPWLSMEEDRHAQRHTSLKVLAFLPWL